MTRDDNKFEQDTPDAPLRRRIEELEAENKAQAEQLRIFEANCCYRHIELDDRARLTALKEVNT